MDIRDINLNKENTMGGDAVTFSTNTKITYGNYKLNVTAGESINTQTGMISELLANNEKLKNITNELKSFMSKDYNEEDLTYEDLAYTTSLKGKHGIKNVKRDANAGIVTFVCDDGIHLSFDFETKAEKEKRIALENKIKEANKNGYDDSYKLATSEDLNKYVITVNDFTCSQPRINHIAKDFGIKAKDLIRLNPHLVENFNPNDNARYIEDTKVDGNVQIKLPTDIVKFNEDGPTGFIKRNFEPFNSNPHSSICVWDTLDEYLDYYYSLK